MILGLLWLAFCAWALWWAWKRWGRPAIVGDAPEEPKRWNFYRLKTKPEPTSADVLIAGAPEPQDPFGYTKVKDIREMVATISPEDKNWSATIPSALSPCYLCGGERIASHGVLACPRCDRAVTEESSIGTS